MIDIAQTIIDMENLCSHEIHRRPKCIRDAMQVLVMWRHLKQQASKWEMGLATHLRVHTVMTKAEEEFFPTKIHQTLKVAIEGMSDTELHIIKDSIECISGVNEVRL